MTTMHELADSLAGWIERLAPREERFARMVDELAATYGADDRPVDEQSLQGLARSVQRHSRHLTVEFRPAGDLVVDDSAHGWPPVAREDVERRAAWVSLVRRDADGLGMLRLDNLDPYEHAAPYLESAFGVLRGCERLILDLRGNGGGDPATLALVLEFVLGPRSAHVSDVRYRDRVRQWWTRERPAHLSLAADAEMVVLVGPRTYSSGEALAYHLQTLGAATVIGSPTSGAADHVTPIALTPDVRALVPEATVTDPRTGSNWEGSGVIPDIPSDDPESAASEVWKDR